jgi:hypothetical protein
MIVQSFYALGAWAIGRTCRSTRVSGFTFAEEVSPMHSFKRQLIFVFLAVIGATAFASETTTQQ